jgi:uncharacterized protein (TIGR02145 family)
MVRRSAVGILAVVLASGCHIEIPQPPPLPPPLGSATDGDGNVYATVVIGNQEWMASNLKTTHYNDGTPIPITEDPAAWASTISPSMSWYANDIANKDVYGALYNWYALQFSELREKICPPNFGLPEHESWGVLTDALGGELVAGGALKEAGASHWASPNAGATNSSGFTGLPAGERNGGGVFDSLGQGAWWWCADTDDFPLADSWFWDLQGANTLSSGSSASWSAGFSIRCARGVTPN